MNRPILTSELDSIINGYIMGDGYIKENGTITVDQGKAQQKFVEWMHTKLKPFCTPESTPKLVTRNRIRNGKVSTTYSYRFNTRALFKDYYNAWYRPTKSLPVNIANLFTPLFITVWFACDGTKPEDYRGSRFEVRACTVEERQLLKKLFKVKHDIDVNIIKNGVSKKGTQQWALSIDSKNYDKFRSLITQDDLIETLFPYKLHSKKP